MPLLILPDRFTEDTIALWRAATAEGWTVQRVSGADVPGAWAEAGAVVYGETFFVERVAESLDLAPLETPLDWLASLPHRHLLRDVAAATLGQARTLTQPRFIKPADDKCFPARVYGSGAELEAADWLGEETPVLTSEPVQWEVEYRCFVREKSVLTLSPYLRHGELARDEQGDWISPPEEAEQALRCAEAVLTDPEVPSPPGFVLDVGRISGRGWDVVEANPAWASGIYGCDPGQVLRVLERSLARRSELTADEAPWSVRTIEVT